MQDVLEWLDEEAKEMNEHLSDYAIEYLKKGLDKAREQCVANGCWGCAYGDVEEWQEPCRRCRRNCKDYWRAKEHVD